MKNTSLFSARLALAALIAFLSLPVAALAQGNDATLSNLFTTPGTLAPSFSSSITNYTVAVSYATASVSVTPARQILPARR
jgi:hypothetical protein